MDMEQAKQVVGQISSCLTSSSCRLQCLLWRQTCTDRNSTSHHSGRSHPQGLRAVSTVSKTIVF